MYITKDANGYLSGYGIGVVTPSVGHIVFILDTDPDDYRAAVLALPGWGGDWRFVVLDDAGQPVAYTPRALTPEEQAADAAAALAAVEATATDKAAAIPGWAKWTEERALAWYAANVDTPLAAATTFAQAKAIMVEMATAQRALIRMVLALRNKTWPHLEDENAEAR